MTETALFAAGCFWGIELEFSRMPGVVKTAVGYSGGDFAKPSYEDVCAGVTGHAEVVRVEFDPVIVTYRILVETFFTLHDPTQIDRQGPDVGTQYRSAIFTTSPEQEQTARAVRDEMVASGRFKRPIATRIEPARDFWPAEDYHQQYLAKRGMGACGV